MNKEQAQEAVRTVLHQVAPEADLEDVREDETLQEALDLDSIDFLNFVTGLQEKTGVEVPERDYPELSTLDGCIAYLMSAS